MQASGMTHIGVPTLILFLSRSKRKQNAERLANAEHNICLAQLRGNLLPNGPLKRRRKPKILKNARPQDLLKYSFLQMF